MITLFVLKERERRFHKKNETGHSLGSDSLITLFTETKHMVKEIGVPRLAAIENRSFIN